MKQILSKQVEHILQSNPVELRTIELAQQTILDLLVAESFTEALWGCVLLVRYLSLHIESLGLLDIPDALIDQIPNPKEDTCSDGNAMDESVEQIKKITTWPWADRLSFWKSLNDNILFCIQCADSDGYQRSSSSGEMGSNDQSVESSGNKELASLVNAEEWLQIRDALLQSSDSLFKYGLIDYDLGLRETAIMDAIHSRLIALSSPHHHHHHHHIHGTL